MVKLINKMLLSFTLSWLIILPTFSAQWMADSNHKSDLAWKLGKAWMVECGASDKCSTDWEASMIAKSFHQYESIENLYTATSWIKKSGSIKQCRDNFHVTQLLDTIRGWDSPSLEAITSWMKESKAWEGCESFSVFSALLTTLKTTKPAQLADLTSWMKDSGIWGNDKTRSGIQNILNMFGSYLSFSRGVQVVNLVSGARNDRFLKLVLTTYSQGTEDFNKVIANAILTPSAALPDEYGSLPLYVACLGTSYEDQRIRNFVMAKLGKTEEREKTLVTMNTVLGSNSPLIERFKGLTESKDATKAVILLPSAQTR